MNLDTTEFHKTPNLTQKCEICDHDPSYFCDFSKDLICQYHHEQHCSLNLAHKHESLIKTVDPYDWQIFTNTLNSRIQSLENLKSIINIQTKKLIIDIETNSKILLRKLDDVIYSLMKKLKMKAFRKFDIEDMKNTNRSEIHLTNLKVEKLKQEIKNSFMIELNDLFTVKLVDVEMNNFHLEHSTGLNCLDVSNDQKILVAGSSDNTVRIWDLEKMSLSSCLCNHKDEVISVAISDNNLYCASGSKDKSIILWSLNNFTFLQIYKGHTDRVNTLHFSKDSNLIVSGSSDKKIIVWKLDSAEIITTIETSSSIYLAFLNSKNHFYVCAGPLLVIWDLISSKKLHETRAHNSDIVSLSSSKNEKLFITVSKERSVGLWENIQETANNKKLSSSAFLPPSSSQFTINDSLFLVSFIDDQKIISCTQKGCISVWSLNTRSKFFEFILNETNISQIQYSNDLIYSLSTNNKISISRLSTQTLESLIILNTYNKNSISIKNDLILYGAGNNLMINKYGTQIETELKGHEGMITQTCISSRLNYFISSACGAKNNLILWIYNDIQNFIVMTGHRNNVNCVDISKDETKSISGDDSGIILIWDMNKLKIESNFSVNDGVKVYNKNIKPGSYDASVTLVKFTDNLKFVASVVMNKYIFIWNLESKSMHAKLSGHLSPIQRLFATNDDKYFVTVNCSEGVYIWHILEKVKLFEYQNLTKAYEWLKNNKDLEGEISRYVFY